MWFSNLFPYSPSTSRRGSKATALTLSVLAVMLVSLLIAVVPSAHADGILDLQALDLSYQQVYGVARDPLYTGNSTPTGYYQLGVKLDCLRYLGVDASLLAGTDQTQFHYGGLQYFAYLRPLERVEIGVAHESLHIFDSSMQGGYPMQDSVEVRVNLFSSGKPRESLF